MEAIADAEPRLRVTWQVLADGFAAMCSAPLASPRGR